MQKLFSIRTIVAIGIGAAVFVILGRFGSIPTGFIPNTNFETAYAFLALMSLLFGPVAGFLIGFIGHTLKDMIMWGAPWFSWIIASGFVGLIIGLAAKRINIEAGEFNNKQKVQFMLTQVIANAVAWLVIAPGLDILIYSEPVNKVFVQGAFAAASNSLMVGVLGTLLVTAYAKTRTKQGSLSKELDLD